MIVMALKDSVFGQLLIGVIQGLALGAGLFFLGVPGVLTLTFIACLVF